MTVDIQRNVVMLELVKGARFDVGDVPTAVRSAGLKPRWIWARGRDELGKLCLWRLDTRSAVPAWDSEPRDITEALRATGEHLEKERER